MILFKALSEMIYLLIRSFSYKYTEMFIEYIEILIMYVRILKHHRLNEKNFMKKLFFTLTILFAGTQLWAQVNQTVIIEHFTNTRCSVCAARNPAFYSLINDYPEVLHIAYHPSSPYSSCIFSQHNPTENDARTNYYGIYGGTPRVVVQGKVVAPQNPLLMASQIEDKLEQAADFVISVEQLQNTDEEAEVSVVVKRIGDNNPENLNLYAIVAEKEIEYNAPNGESLHHDVFRKVLTDMPVSIANVGDSVVLNTDYSIDAEWVANQMYVAVMLQDESSKTVLQSAASELLSNPQSVADHKITISDDLFVPNPALHYIRLNKTYQKQILLAEIFDLKGQKLIAVNGTETIDVSGLKQGLYIVIARDMDGMRYATKFLKSGY